MMGRVATNDLQYVQDELNKVSITDLQVVADESGIPFGTLHKIKYGVTKNPGFNTVTKAAEYFRTKKRAGSRASVLAGTR